MDLAAARPPIVFVTPSLPDDLVGRLSAAAIVDVWCGERPPSAEQLAERCASASGILTTPADRVDRALLDACPGLRVVSNLAVGFDNVDVDELSRRSIPLGHTPGVLTEATADLALALILATTRRLFAARDAVVDGRWHGWEPDFMLGLELSGATLGIVGLGRIGRAVARRALACGMDVVAWSRSGRPVEEAGLEAVRLVAFDTLLATSDVVSLHVALEPSTIHLIGARELSAMKPSAVLVNTARGAVVDQAALVQALASGVIAGAGLDVVETEPISVDDPLLALETCVVLPHIGSATVATRRAMAELAADNLLAGLAGERLPACANPVVYTG